VIKIAINFIIKNIIKYSNNFSLKYKCLNYIKSLIFML
jgi:hypothetical protein